MPRASLALGEARTARSGWDRTCKRLRWRFSPASWRRCRCCFFRRCRGDRRCWPWRWRICSGAFVGRPARSARTRRPAARRRHRRDSQLERPRPAGEVSSRRSSPRCRLIPTTKSSWSTTARPTAAPTSLENRFPQVRLLALARQSRASAAAPTPASAHAANDIVVLLNSDMRVEPDFLAPLLAGFTDEKVFAVSCQIFFSDPNKLREETGLTQGWWEDGRLRVRHRDRRRSDRDLYPCFYGGGGSCAFDRSKFLELGGFDALLRPVLPRRHRPRLHGLEARLEGALSARKHRLSRAPRHHRQDILAATTSSPSSRRTSCSSAGRTFTNGRWFSAFLFHVCRRVAQPPVRRRPRSGRTLAGLARAFLQLPRALASRWRARTLAVVDDTEAFRRPLGGYFRDRFACASTPSRDRLRVLFVSPYPICPPMHGGGVFMYQTCRELADLTDVHLIVLLDSPGERAAHDELVR